MSELAIPPIVVDDRGDIALYATLEAASRELEAIDVLDAIYEVFDSRGRRLSVTAAGGLVSIRLDPQSVPESDELLRRLRHFISRVGADRVGVEDAESASLDVAVRALAQFFHVA
ncbi:MAG: hypothetical protein ACRCXL_16285 [Dermatophilaceae bacterium]